MLEVDPNRYLMRSATALDTLAQDLGTQELAIGDGAAVRVRPLEALHEVVVKAAIPDPVPGEGVSKTQMDAMVKNKHELVKAGLCAVSIVGYSISGQNEPPITFDKPGGADPAEGRLRWVREAAYKVLREMHSEHIGRVVAVADALAKRDAKGLAALVAQAGKGSGPGSTKSKPSAGPEEKSPS